MEKIFFKNLNEELSYTVVGDSYANNNTLDIWIKFSGYLKNDELMFMESLKNKDINKISQMELDKYYKIKTQLNMCELFKKYKLRECTKEEHDLVFNYMNNNSLTKFVNDRMTEYEIKDANNYALSFRKNEAKIFVETYENKYDHLNVYDAYVLFIIKDNLYKVEQKELNDKIRYEQHQREIHLIKSLIRDYGTIR